MISNNRDEFLKGLAEKFGREFNPNPEPVPPMTNDYRATRLADLERPDLLKNYVEYSRSIGITVNICKPDQLCQAMQDEVARLGGGPVIFNNDPRLLDCGIVDALNQQATKVYVWDKAIDRQNIDNSQDSNVGIVFAEAGLTETGTIILESDKEYGRSVSLLPNYSIVVLKASTVFPRMHQYSAELDKRVKAGERVPSVVNLISGPSSTADIELVKVIGVHGPVAICYILIDDDDSCVEIPHTV